ncbi:MAG TPA: GHMP kinase [Chloroflexota bacterium]|nr:GHMP kinase [Chloroflexota bacterium]
MLIVRAPTRISLGGGGTDLEAYYALKGGLVVSAAINRYCYVVVQAADNDEIEIVGSNYHNLTLEPSVNSLPWNGSLALPRAAVRHFRLRRGLRICFGSEVPPGTGLGSSSSLAVALVQGLSSVVGEAPNRAAVAEVASDLEINHLKMPIGRQDQYAAAFGGLNAITFSSDGVRVEPIQMGTANRQRLERNLMLFYTGTTRHSSDILKHQQRRTAHAVPDVIESLDAIKAFAGDVRSELEKGNLDAVGELLDLGWQRKKTLAPSISNAFIDECYALARSKGALGGKITGAGGGGFLMFYCPRRAQPAVRAALAARGLIPMDFTFDYSGVHQLLHAMKVDTSSLRSNGHDGGRAALQSLASPTIRRIDHATPARARKARAAGGSSE